ncbi:DUF3445 domain-containing protein [Asticcacaulis sp. YBE204]|uniref:heme-dependent oxidative N-demethylase family protein n=1 Tax=Asticcacaulis sp. YBE204 TaxID=1282363 RepID=UPI0003C3BF60|nr:DUF3445 domain-containing protein [Asticcacaulis sp. YBE204]ESQ79842.1 hypothetical protein AEYBE204_08330 [Asticcacaulis sp. YBE204]
MHTPFDGSQPLFRIGLSPLGDTPWLEQDERLPVYLAEKARLFAETRGTVWGAEPGSEAAQTEAHDLIRTLLGLPPETPAEPSLLAAARLVAEDLAILQKSPEGWRLTAGAICFPSSWLIAEKLGKALHEVHAPVPDFSEGTRNAAVIERIFDNLRPDEPVIRWNWSLYGNDTLHHPHVAPPQRFGNGPDADSVFIRVERQTLRKLPDSGAVLFSIGIQLTPLDALATHPDGKIWLRELIFQVENLTPLQLEYKGLSFECNRLLNRLITLRDAL